MANFWNVEVEMREIIIESESTYIAFASYLYYYVLVMGLFVFDLIVCLLVITPDQSL